MKILMVAYGESQHSQRPLKWLLEKGHEVLFVDSFNPLPNGAKGYSFYKINNYPYFLSLVNIFNYELTYKFREKIIYYDLTKKISEFNPDIIHIHYLDDRARYINEIGFKPYVISIWGTDVNGCFLKPKLTRECLMRGLALRDADKIIIDDNSIIDKCNILAGEKIPTEYLHLGVDIKCFQRDHTEEINAWRTKLNIEKNTIVLFSPRIWKKLYSHMEILEAFSCAINKFSDRKFVIIFKRAFANTLKAKNYEKKFTRLAHKLGVWEHVRLLDQVNFKDIPTLYKLSDLVINFPKYDAFPVTLAEAALCNVPVVTCLLPAYQNTFAEKYFRTVETGNIKALQEAIVAEIKNFGSVEQRNRILKATQEAKDYFDENIYKNRITNLYKDLIP